MAACLQQQQQQQQQQQYESVPNKKLAIDGDRDKISNLENDGNQLINFEAHQKARMSYLSRNSVIEKIVKLIDTPKSPPESPTDPDDNSPSCSKVMSMYFYCSSLNFCINLIILCFCFFFVTDEITELSQLLDAFPDLMSVRHTNESNFQNKLLNVRWCFYRQFLNFE
jgi:hypothetical protein